MLVPAVILVVTPLTTSLTHTCLCVVELLEFRLQQEQVLVQKLRGSLSLEQDIAAQLRTELEQKHTLLETTASSQQELHSETCRLRYCSPAASLSKHIPADADLAIH